MKDPTIGSRLAPWKIKLQRSYYKIQYKPGRVNANADALSHNPVSLERINEIKETDNVDRNSSDNDDDMNGYVPGSKILYKEYPIERVFVSTCEVDNEYHNSVEMIENIYREVLDRNDVDVEVSEERVERCTNIIGLVESETREREKLQTMPKPSSMGCESRWSEEASGTDTYVPDGYGSTHPGTPVVWFPEGHGKTPDTGCDVSQPPASPPYPGYVRALGKDTADGGKHVQSREAVETWATGYLLLEGVVSNETRFSRRVSRRGGLNGGDMLSQQKGILWTSWPRGKRVHPGGWPYGSTKLPRVPYGSGPVLEGDKNDDSDDDDDLDKLEFEKMQGVWGDIVSSRDEADDEDERPGKRIKLSEGATTLATRSLHAGSKQRNPVLTPLFQLSRDKLWMRDDHILNFVSCDGVLTTPLGRELLDNSIIKSSQLKDPQAFIGYVTSILMIDVWFIICI